MNNLLGVNHMKKVTYLWLCVWVIVGCSRAQPGTPPLPNTQVESVEKDTAPLPVVEPTDLPDPAVDSAIVTNVPEPTAIIIATSTEAGENEDQVDLTQIWSYGLTSIRTGEPLVEAGGEHNLEESMVSYGYNLVVDRNGNVLTPSGVPLQGGEQLILTTEYQEDHNMREYARIYSLMAPIRDTILYHFEETSKDEWLALTEVLTINNLKTTDAAAIDSRSILSTKQVYDYVASGPTDGSPVMRFLEEADLELKCLAFVDFDFTNPEGSNHCEEHNLAVGSGIKIP